ncbi:MAG: zinc ribbon domain-containing protein [Elusimicrobia bacterium]|nr:zinc ribbon domain-containing protein [Elusimicrobiota bacterium]
MSNAAILCTQCGAASATPLSQCAKCGGKNTRVCGGCGFQNSLAKNYCDKCGNPISDLGTVVAPPPPTAIPGAPKSDIPATVVKHIVKGPLGKKDPPPPAAPAPGALPPAKMKAVEPGAALGPAPSAPLPVAGRQARDQFAAPSVSNDPWSAVAPPQADDVPKPPRWIGTVRRTVTVAFATFAVVASLVTVWYWTENNKPENASHRAAIQYLEALRARNYAAAYSQFSESARKYCTLDEFVASRDTSTWAWSGLRVDHIEPGAVLLAYELAIEGAAPRTDRVLFVEENKKWVRPYSWVLMRKVEEAFEKNNADMGLILAQAAAPVNPRDPMARGYLCEAAYYRKSPGDTERQCLAAIELSRVYPSNLTLKSLYHLHAILADTYKNALRKPELALDQFAQMLAFPSISPADQCEILLARSEAYLTLSRPGEALSDADRAGQLCVRSQDLAYIQEIRRKLNAPNQ